jgi:HK97 family phage portal protein
MWEAITTWLNYRGEVFLWCTPAQGRNLPAELFPLNPDYFKEKIVNGELVAWYYEVNGTRIELTLDEVIQFKLFNPSNPYRGLSPISAVSMEMNFDYTASKYGNKFFANSAQATGVIEIPAESDVTNEELRKLKNMWEGQHKGVDNAFKIGFLKGGMKYNNVSLSQRDAEFLESRKFSLTAILAVFGVPPMIAGFINSGEVNRSTSVSLRRIFWSNTLKPQLMRIQEKLGAEFFQIYAPGYEGKFDLSNIPELRPDMLDTLDAANKMFSLGYTRNEANERLDMQMPTDPDGDIRYIPSNYVPVDDSSDATPAEDDDDPFIDDDKSIENMTLKNALLTKAKERYHRRFLDLQSQAEETVTSKLKRFLFEQRTDVLKLTNSGVVETLISEIGGLVEDQKGKLTKNLRPTYEGIMKQAGEMALGNIYLQRSINGLQVKDIDVSFDVPPFEVDAEILLRRLNLVRNMSDVIFEHMKREINERIAAGGTIQEIRDAIKNSYNMSSSRANVVARTETASLINGQQESIYRKENISEKEWISTVDANTRQSHVDANGEVVGINDKFSNGLMFPGDPSGSAEETINCRCAVAPVVR